MKKEIKIKDNEIVGDLLYKTPSQISKEILGHYFTIDGNNATVRLNFDTFAELVDLSLGDDNVEKLNETLFAKLEEVFSLIPRKFKIDVEIYIKDLGDYTIEEAEKIVRDNIVLLIYMLGIERRKKNITGLLLLGGGVALLLVSYFLNRLNLPQLLYDVINISGTLLVWESANLTLIERSADAKRAKQYLRKFKSIRLLQA